MGRRREQIQVLQAPFYLSTSPMTSPPQQHYLTLEELKLTHNSCWLCGCNWQQDHVSLDCSECGGYALTRPCPSCEGQCKQVWLRNISATHDQHRALWVGQCALAEKNCKLSCSAELATADSSSNNNNNNDNTNATGGPNKATTTGTIIKSVSLISPSSVCSSQPSSASSSDSECDFHHHEEPLCATYQRQHHPLQHRVLAPVSPKSQQQQQQHSTSSHSSDLSEDTQ